MCNVCIAKLRESTIALCLEGEGTFIVANAKFVCLSHRETPDSSRRQKKLMQNGPGHVHMKFSHSRCPKIVKISMSNLKIEENAEKRRNKRFLEFGWMDTVQYRISRIKSYF